MEGPRTPAYWDYLRLDRLLSLQGGLEGDEGRLMTDELHFIVVHQVFELWFKLVLRELRLARDHLAAPVVPEGHVPHVVHHLRRVNEILRLQVDQFRVMETLTPQDFLAFRDKLIPASGFQSFQLREIEILLGLEEEARVPFGDADPIEVIRRAAAAGGATGAMAWGRIQAARGETHLRGALEAWLERTPIHGSGPADPGDDATVQGFVADYLAAYAGNLEAQVPRMAASLEADEAMLRGRTAADVDSARRFLEAGDVPEAQRPRRRRVRAGALFIESYRELPLLAWPRALVDSVVELEEMLVLWRTRHARMVERTIGRRMGTGGSSGVDYLDRTARARVFGDLWTVRSILVPRDLLPPLRKAEVYGFAARR
ncbi:MAG: tryptophan 2,3-dioxygenase [Planctomycetes bacterium]|nr:tryptophan 2,3-dioxygenase [Planctomycetota bacterium]